MVTGRVLHQARYQATLFKPQCSDNNKAPQGVIMDPAPFFKMMVDKSASDLFFSTGAPVTIKVEGKLMPLAEAKLQPGSVKEIAYALMNDDQIEEFERELEMNMGISIKGVGRFRINIFKQRGEVSLVARHVKTDIPSFDELGLPPILKEFIMYPRGLILVAGATGVGKSTTMASMLEYRNINMPGHILTVEDPIEFVYVNKKSIVNQREVGIDTHSYHRALSNAMREAPDVILIGEVRDAETMHQALAYADTGHLCLATIHANNADQTMDRVINFFEKSAREQLLMDLSLNMRAIVAQRLVMGNHGKRLPAIEILMNTPHIAELIQNGQLDEIKEAMNTAHEPGLCTFDQALFNLYKSDRITKEEALKHADSPNDLNLKMRFSGDEESGLY
jgi:twitching motility protein PilU